MILRSHLISALIRLLVLSIAVLGPVRMAQSHPHVFVEATSHLVFDDKGYAVAVEHVFRFDDAFTAFAIQGFDTNNDGVYDRNELSELAKVNIESMGEFGYFTFGDNARVELDFNAPLEDYWLEVADVLVADYWAMKPEDIQAMKDDEIRNGTKMPETFQLLELHFTLPLKSPTDATRPITLDVYDPTYYVDFRFSKRADAVGMRNAPPSCTFERRDPPPMDDAAAFALAQIGADQRDIPPELQDAAASQINQLIVTCANAPEMVLADGSKSASGTRDPAPMSPDAAKAEGQAAIDAALNTSAQQPGDAARNTEEQTASEQPAAGASQSRRGLADRWFGTIASFQAEFYQKLISAMRAFRTNPNAGWLLVGISFLYGIFHAAGPGHGKAVISSYLLANNETLKKGILLSFLSAFAQAVTAVLLIGVAAISLKLTSIAIQDTARWFEIGSYALVMLLGMVLLWQKLFRPAIMGGHDHGHDHGHSHAPHDHGHHDHHHGHSHCHGSHSHHDHYAHEDHVVGADGVCESCGHSHAPTPDMLKEPLSLGRMVSIILAVGLRPCSGALIVLVFALSQNMIWAGVASTFAMAVGTGITVSVLASLAVGARDLATRLFGKESVMAARIQRTLGILGAFIVFFLGLTLLVATAGWG
ncbi:HoxN/HupN/NixA family nickel/cobalt transporter [Roseibium suaedae]|uniref:ABC-type nickel/cobalt efflux system, permease component RcnA n=1 Tax=Roseibium suaedae TaxID=735517 RepID=A0A1M7J0E8_9HYPH|nr:DUF1007 family protein [Roseibium suaedae]SHM46476.1 ABC-type nickel/cobalt efflux system, permease component RcnA [Roseibium suaedae]